MTDRKTTRDDEIIRDILVRVSESENVNQRTLAKELGIALGMANTYMKRCVRKGYIKISQVPPNRYAYFLTPQGFSEKTRLTAQYLSDSLVYFRRARNQYGAIYQSCVDAGWSRLALAGISELGEIATLYARDYEVSLEAMIEPRRTGEKFLGLPVVSDVSSILALDAVVVSDMRQPQETYDSLTQTMPSARVLVPRILPVILAETAFAAGA